jgi:hypothetical protein
VTTGTVTVGGAMTGIGSDTGAPGVPKDGGSAGDVNTGGRAADLGGGTAGPTSPGVVERLDVGGRGSPAGPEHAAAEARAKPNASARNRSVMAWSPPARSV